jgi:hypothetical protein
MANIELRPPKRRIHKERDPLLPILCATVAIGVAGFMFLKHSEKAARQISEETPVGDTAAAVPERMTEPAPAPQRRRAAPENRITTESGRTYDVEPTSPNSYDRDEPTVAERYARASRIMEQSRNLQRQIDRQNYGGNGVIDAQTGPQSYECRSIKEAKERLDERMRRYGYADLEAERLHEEWRQLNKSMIRFQCH